VCFLVLFIDPKAVAFTKWSLMEFKWHTAIPFQVTERKSHLGRRVQIQMFVAVLPNRTSALAESDVSLGTCLFPNRHSVLSILSRHYSLLVCRRSEFQNDWKTDSPVAEKRLARQSFGVRC
jgi:hypothetical protein